MTLGQTPPNADLYRSTRALCRASWRRYRATRPKVERKLAHMMRREHGGRHARMRGRLRVAHDFALLAAAVNLGRSASYGLHRAATA